MSAAYTYSCGIKRDGTTACWGDDYYGQSPQVALFPQTLTNGAMGTGYAQALFLQDSAPNATSDYPYQPPSPGFAIISGNLPAGLGLDSGGAISGAPGLGGVFYFSVEGEDANGFNATRSYSISIDGTTDTTPPIIDVHANGPTGAMDWFTGDVTLSWAVVDLESPVTITTGCNSSVLASDTIDTSFTCTATSAGGTSIKTVHVRRDGTPPTLAPQVSPTMILLGGSGVVTSNASDSTSGLATAICDDVTTNSIGSHPISCTATDMAGNRIQASTAYSVIFGFVGFSPPVDNPPTVNVANAGQTIPFKWRLVRADGAPIPTLTTVVLKVYDIACDGSSASDEVDQYTSAAAGFQNFGNGDYQYNWKTPKTYQARCKKVVLDLGDGSTRFALFRFH